jgi:hypothetical protein
LNKGEPMQGCDLSHADRESHAIQGGWSFLLAAALLVAASGCVVGEEPEGDAADDEMALGAAGAQSPADRVIVWQQNIEGMKAGKASPGPMTSAMLSYTYRPDIVIFQEAWQKVLCGDYLDPLAIAGDADLNNWKGSLRDANGLSSTCRLGNDPLEGSVLEQIARALWGGVGNLGQRRPFSDTLGQHTATGTAIAWDSSRFVFEDDFVYDDSMVPGCTDTLKAYHRIAVLLRDTRRTSALDDDQLIAVASVHYGSVCPSSNNKYVAEQMIARWAYFDGLPLSRRILAGDFNLRVDESSATYEQRRREEAPRSWYVSVTTDASWVGGSFLDPVKVRHGSGTGDSADLCGQWTYPNVQSCALSTACSSTCPGFGIGGKLDRLDYVFVSDATGTLAGSRIASALTDEGGASYADHKATRVSLLYDD